MDETASLVCRVEKTRCPVIAARSAGMQCVGYQNPHSGNQDLGMADRIIDDMRDFPWEMIG